MPCYRPLGTLGSHRPERVNHFNAEKLRKQNTNKDHFICPRLIPAPVSLALRGGRGPQIIKEEALRFGKNSAVSDSLTANGPTFLLHTERSASGLEVSGYTDLHRAN